jgi:hypothetical protein
MRDDDQLTLPQTDAAVITATASTPDDVRVAPDTAMLSRRPGVAHRLDVRLHHLLMRLFPEPALDAVAFLEHLCYGATEIPYTLFPGQPPVPVLVVACPKAAELVARPGWRWSQETTLLLLQMLEALQVLLRRRTKAGTEIHVPLGDRSPLSLDPAVLCAHLAQSPHKSRKAQRFIERLQSRLRRLLPPRGTEPENPEDTASPTAVAAWQENLLTLLAEEGVSKPCRQRVAFRLALAAPALPVEAMAPTALSHPSSDPLQESGSPSADQRTQEARPSPEAVLGGDVPLTVAKRHSFAPEEFATIGNTDEPIEILSLYPTVNAEVDTIWDLLATPDQKQYDQGFNLSRLRKLVLKDHRFARAAMINVLLQNAFPDSSGTVGIGWFVHTFGRYDKRTLFPTPEIASWAAQPMTYTQIQAALLAERERQKREDPFGLLHHRPDASCLDLHHPDPVEAPLEPDALPPTSEDANRDAPVQQEEHEAMRHAPQEGQSVSDAPPAVPEHEEGAQSSEEGTDVVRVDDPERGWRKEERARWWGERLLRDTDLGQTCRVEVWPTQHGRFVLWVIPRADSGQAWLWCSTAEVTAYLDEERAARRERVATERQGGR